jgi:hypothetical protein
MPKPIYKHAVEPVPAIVRVENWIACLRSILLQKGIVGVALDKEVGLQFLKDIEECLADTEDPFDLKDNNE